MGKIKFLLLLFVGAVCYCQQGHYGIVLSSDGGEPLEFVSVFNSEDHTITNADGRFRFSSAVDSVYFYSPGHEKLKTTFQQLRDTIFLQKNIVNLDEVVVTNAKTILQRIKDSIAINYELTPHTETFFIRALLRRNDTIVRLQDMYGNLKRKTLLYSGDMNLEKKDYEVELLQMRQVGIKKDENNIYFIFPSFYVIFSEFVRINAMGPDFEVVEKPMDGTNEIRVEFSSNGKENTTASQGHYIINTADNAILSFNMEWKEPASESMKQELEYDATVRLESATYFSKDASHNRYFMNFAKQNAAVESKTIEQKEPTIFEIELILHTTNPFSSLNVKSNVNEHKDVFKLKLPYDPAFWESQNQLLLTDEMLAFISQLADDASEFKIKSNLD